MSSDGKQLRAGVFLFGSIAILVLAVFLVGRTQTLFARRIKLSADFDNTGGLVVGAAVRLAGVDVGTVNGIRFDRDLHERRVRVTLAIDHRYAERIRADSLAHLTSKGLLGDTIIDITVGSSDAPPVQDGALLKSEERADLGSAMTSVLGAVGDVRSLAGTVEKRVNAVFTDELGRDLGRIAHSTAAVVENVERGRGLAHEVVYDRRLADDARETVAHARALAGDALATVDRVDSIVRAVQTGDGTLHGLVYRDDAGKLLGELQRAATKFGAIADEVKSGHGLLHTLVYERDRGNLVENLTELSRILRQLGEEVEQGKGTLGGLIKDPTVYEDIKGIVGSVRRSAVLRGLIRYTIKHDGLSAK